MSTALGLDFHHAGVAHTLSAGGRWAAPAMGETYHDTAADTLRAIVAAIEQDQPWREVVAKQYAPANPWLHAIVTSPARDLFFRLHPPPAGARVLDIGAGWGQIALALARRGDLTVTALEPTPERLDFIAAVARQENTAGRMHFLQADFQAVDFPPVFDLACCIGVLEWVPKFCPGEPRAVQVDFLRRVRRTLRPGGRLVVGIENRLGLKYLLGARDDHTGQRNVSVLDAAAAAAKHRAVTGQELRAFTYSLAEYAALFREAGFVSTKAHATFPDYKLPELILPCEPADACNRALLAASLPAEHDGHDGHTLPDPEAFRSHYRSLAHLGIAHCLCPSYFFVVQ
jgi:SAM-dependent methyltransferase